MTRTRKKTKPRVRPEALPALPIRSSWIDDQGWCVWLAQDPASVPAMLRGRGDGREKLYEKYARYWKKRNPALSEETLHDSYAQYALYRDKIVAEELQAEAQQTAKQDEANQSAFFVGRFTDRSQSRVEILWRVDRRWGFLLLVAIAAYGVARYV